MVICVGHFPPKWGTFKRKKIKIKILKPYFLTHFYFSHFSYYFIFLRPASLLLFNLLSSEMQRRNPQTRQTKTKIFFLSQNRIYILVRGSTSPNKSRHTPSLIWQDPKPSKQSKLLRVTRNSYFHSKTIFDFFLE